MKQIYKLSILVLLAFFTQANAQSPEEKILSIAPEIDQIFNDFQKDRNLSSLAYALVLDGKIIHSSYLGIINQETQKKSNKNSVYRIASMSKSFAGMAILQLRDAGKLRLEDPVVKFIPQLQGNKYREDVKDLTVWNLLTHTAGLPEDNPWGDRQLGISTKEMLDIFEKGLSFSNEPGVAYEYSNTAFAMIGYIIYQVTGQTFEEYITENIFKPLNMNHTYWDYKEVPADDLAHGYRWVYDKFVPQPILGAGAYGIMGGILTSLEDFAKYMAVHQKVYEDFDNPSVLKRSSIKEMHYPWSYNETAVNGYDGDGKPCINTAHYGYGLRLERNCENIDMIGHSGGLPGYGSDWKILPQYGLGIVTVANGTYGSAAVLNREVLPLIVKKANLERKPFPVSEILKQRQSELMEVVKDWNKGPETGIFAVNFFDDNYIEMLNEATQKEFGKIGKIQKVHEMQTQNSLRGKFRVDGEKGSLEISFTLSPENPPLIQAYRIRGL